MILHSVSWHGYEVLLREIGDQRVRLTYDDGDLEFQTLSLGHENAGEWIGRLIFFLALQWNIPIFSGGSTTSPHGLCRTSRNEFPAVPGRSLRC